MKWNNVICWKCWAFFFIGIIWKEVTDVGQFVNITDERHFPASRWSKLKCSAGTATCKFAMCNILLISN